MSQTCNAIRSSLCKTDETPFLVEREEIYILRIITIEFKELKFMSDFF